MKQVAIVGCGSIAQVHARVLNSFTDVKLSAFADTISASAQSMTAQYGGHAYTSLEELLAQETIDVLHICTPHYLHTPMAELAAAKNIGIFTEKPPVITKQQWTAFSALNEQIPIGICFQNRYNQTVQYIKNLLSSGKTGSLKGGRAFVTWKRDAPYYTESGWRGKWGTEGGGVLINQSIHTLDLLVQFFGQPKGVEAFAANHHLKGIIEVEDTLEAYIQFSDGAVNFYATSSYCTDAPVLMELCCENVVIRMEENEITCRWNDGKVEQLHFAEPEALGKSYWGNGHYACIRDFYDCLQSDRIFPINVKTVELTMKLMLDIYESIDTACDHREFAPSI